MKGWFISETITRKSTGDITLHQYEVKNMKIYTLSSLIDNHQLFVNLHKMLILQQIVFAKIIQSILSGIGPKIFQEFLMVLAKLLFV